MKPLSVPRSPTKTAALIVNFAGVDVETFVGQKGGSGVGGSHLHTNSGAAALFDHDRPAVQGICFGLKVRRKKKVKQMSEHATLGNSGDFKTAKFGETFPHQGLNN